MLCECVATSSKFHYCRTGVTALYLELNIVRLTQVAYAWLVFADRGATSPRAVYAAFARKRTVRRGLWRQPNVAALAEQLALSDYKTPAARRAARS